MKALRDSSLDAIRAVGGGEGETQERHFQPSFNSAVRVELQCLMKKPAHKHKSPTCSGAYSR
jgi:hypothetical protein